MFMHYFLDAYITTKYSYLRQPSTRHLSSFLKNLYTLYEFQGINTGLKYKLIEVKSVFLPKATNQVLCTIPPHL